MRGAAAADLLVVGEGDMDRSRQRHGEELGNHGEHAGEEALHVGRAPSPKTYAVRGEAERIARPDLALDRHHVHVAGEDVARPVARPDRREEVGPVALGPGDHRALDPMARELCAHPVDDRRIRGARQRRDRHEIGEDGLDRGRHVWDPPRCAVRTVITADAGADCAKAPRNRAIPCGGFGRSGDICGPKSARVRPSQPGAAA